MNAKTKTLAATAFVATLFLTVSCKGKAEQNSETTTDQTESVKKKGKEYTSAYVCLMHCEGSGSDKEGNCPTCGMAYVDNKEHTKDGHKHE